MMAEPEVPFQLTCNEHACQPASMLLLMLQAVVAVRLHRETVRAPHDACRRQWGCSGQARTQVPG